MRSLGLDPCFWGLTRVFWHLLVGTSFLSACSSCHPSTWPASYMCTPSPSPLLLTRFGTQAYKLNLE